MATETKTTTRPEPLAWAASRALLKIAEAGHRTAAARLDVTGGTEKQPARAHRPNVRPP